MENGGKIIQIVRDFLATKIRSPVGQLIIGAAAGLVVSYEAFRIVKPALKIAAIVFLAIFSTEERFNFFSGGSREEDRGDSRTPLCFTWTREHISDYLLKHNKRLMAAFVGGLLAGFVFC